MKKGCIFVLTIVFFLLSLSLFSCNKKSDGVNVYMPDGTPALALANLLDKGFDYNSAKTNFHIVKAEEIGARVEQGSADLAILPTTLAAKLYKSGIGIQLVSVNVFGNLFIVGTKSTTSLADLKGKVIYTTAATTMQMVKYVLDGNSIAYEEGAEAVADKVVLSSVGDGSEIISRLKKGMSLGAEVYGVLGEPQVTKAQSAVSGLSISVDLQSEYQKLTSFVGYPQACLVVNNSFAAKSSGYISAFLEALESNEEYLTANVLKLPEVFARYESSLANMTFTAETIARCNLRLKLAQDVKKEVVDYAKKLDNIDLTDGFFYGV